MTSDATSSQSTGRIFVLEPEPFLGPALQRAFDGEEIPVRSVRLVGDLVKNSGPCICVLSTEIDPDAVARFLQDIRLARTIACVVIVPDGQLAEVEWGLREIGAVSVVDSSVRGDELAVICRKLLNSGSLGKHPLEHHV